MVEKILRFAYRWRAGASTEPGRRTPVTNPDTDRLRDLNAAPFNRLPGAVWLLIVTVLGVEALLSAAGWGPVSYTHLTLPTSDLV